jgi:hypothetical protein
MYLNLTPGASPLLQRYPQVCHTIFLIVVGESPVDIRRGNPESNWGAASIVNWGYVMAESEMDTDGVCQVAKHNEILMII